MTTKRIVLGAASLLFGICGGCSGSGGEGSTESLDGGVDRFDDNYINEVCQRMDGCNMGADLSVSECVATGTDILGGHTNTQQEAFQRSLGSCLDVHHDCDSFATCIDEAVEDLGGELDGGTNPPNACGTTGTPCTANADCCGSYRCVDFGDSISCALTCTGDSQCLGDSCCVSLEGGGGACGPASFCAGGGGGDTCGYNNCTDSPYTGYRYECVDGRCVCKKRCQPFGSSVCCGGSLCAGDCIGNPCCS